MRRRICILFFSLVLLFSCVGMLACADNNDDDDIGYDGTYYSFSRGNIVDGVSLSINDGTFVLGDDYGNVSGYAHIADTEIQLYIEDEGEQRLWSGIINNGVIKFSDSSAVRMYFCKRGKAPHDIEGDGGYSNMLIFRDDAVAVFPNITGELVIPLSYGGRAITKIGDYAFYDCCSLTNITIPNRESISDLHPIDFI